MKRTLRTTLHINSRA